MSKRFRGGVGQSQVSTKRRALVGLGMLGSMCSWAAVAAAKTRISVADFGGIPDYVGDPLYDGEDQSRVKASDNTEAFRMAVEAALSAGIREVHLPAGHWGIRAGNLKFSTFERLRITGAGIERTVLDFICESTHHSSYVESGSENCIATFEAGSDLEFSDLTVKATTKSGVVNDGPIPGVVYFGAVWGFSICCVQRVRLTRVRVERFNYRGFNIYSPRRLGDTVSVTMEDCQGFHNTGSGFWVANTREFRVFGGEFAYNGIFGYAGTGYGVTATYGVGLFFVRRVRCHHNYRKGIDSHGCTTVDVRDSAFENNVLYHIAVPNNAPPKGRPCSVVISNNKLVNNVDGADAEWLKRCYLALLAHGYHGEERVGPSSCCAIYVERESTTSEPLETVDISDNTVSALYNGGDLGPSQTQPLIYLRAEAARIRLSGNKWDFNGASFNNDGSGDARNHSVFVLRARTVTLEHETVNFQAVTSYRNPASKAVETGTLFELDMYEANLGVNLGISDSEFSVNDVSLLAFTNRVHSSKAAGQKYPMRWANRLSSRKFFRNVIRYRASETGGLFGNFLFGSPAAAASLEHRGNEVRFGRDRFDD
jgi:hypothetical protein